MDDVLVATDDERILKTVEGFGGKAVMTRADHKSGTDRCYEAYVLQGEHVPTWSSTSRATNLSSNRSSWRP